MPNGRRGSDHPNNLSEFLLEKIEESGKWEVEKTYGATSNNVGEERVVVKHKESGNRTYIWIEEYCIWGSVAELRNTLSMLRNKLEEIGLDLEK